MGLHNHHYPRPLIPNTQDLSAVDFRAFYPYTPNEVKHRKRTTSQQLKVLEAVFKQDTKPNAQLRQDLASELSMTARGVQVWFQNRRAKEKARAGRVSLAARATSFVDELKEEEDDDGALHNIVKTEALPTDLLLRETPEQLNASPSPLSDTNPPSHAPSPPELRVITDSAIFNWTNNEVNEPPPDSATSCASSCLPTVPSRTALPNTRFASCLDLDSEDLYSLRRGSLPVTSSFYDTQVSQHVHPLDPLVRRCSVDASLQRLALHPYANFARAKNSALYGAGIGVAASDATSNDVPPMSADASSHYHLMNNRHYGTPRLQRRFVSSSALSAAAQYGSSLSTAHYSNVRRLSMDSRAPRISSLQRMRHSPSPSPLSTYSTTTRTSLPEPRIYSFTARPVGPLIPGPLPMPGFQFGAASSTSSIASPSSVDSERNSPDSIRSFPFGGDEENQPSPPYETYTSRFSSVASLATSESSLNSGYYGGPTVDHNRQNSTCAPQYYAPSSNLDVGRPDMHSTEEMGIPTGIVVGYSPPEDYAYGGADGLPLSIPDLRRLQQAQSEPLRQHQAYVSPIIPVIGTTSENHGHGQDAPNVPISTSSELAFALERKHPELKSISTITQSSTPEAYVNYSPAEQVSQSPAEHYPHQQPTYYTADVQTYHQEQPAYPTPYPFTNGVQVVQQSSDFGIYSASGDYSDPLVPPETLQTAESFVAYS